MGKLTGMESVSETPEKVLLMYQAVNCLVGEGVALPEMRVSAITTRAGIGKGTAYEYFETKEELLACAFIFYVNRIAERISDSLGKLGSLREQLDYVFCQLDEDSQKKYCFVRFVHAVTDDSRFSRLVRDKLMRAPEARNFPEYLFGDIIRQGVERGEINGEIPADYLIYTVFCKVLTYMMSICTEECFHTDVRQIRELVIEGIIRDLKG